MRKKPELVHHCLLLANEAVADSWFRLKLRSPGLSAAAPGQFAQLLLGPGTDPLLPRPLSIHFADPEAAEIQLLVQAAGSGTSRAAGYTAGMELKLLGPFGQGFPYIDEASAPLLVGGGIGMAPLYFLAARRRRAGLPCELLIGGRHALSLPGEAYFAEHGLRPRIATEDGSRGIRGQVTALLEERLNTGDKPSRIHACGPLLMLERIVEIGRALAIPTHISLESRLACAVGACLGCAFPIKNNGQIEYRRVCRDGPVFDGEDVHFAR